MKKKGVFEMCKVIEEWNLGQTGIYVLLLNEETPFKPFWKYRIGGKIYDPVPVTGSNKAISVKGEGDFVGKEVEFLNEKVLP